MLKEEGSGYGQGGRVGRPAPARRCAGGGDGGHQRPRCHAGGIVLAGRALLDSIIDLRVPRLLFIVRNAFGGAYASWNSYHTGADMVFAFPGARVAVMGPAGREYIYKDELVKARAKLQEAIKAGREEEGKAEFNRVIAEMNARYENELMNPKEALALGSISRIVMPGDSRRVLGQALNFYMRRYKPGPLSEPQREFH